MLCASGVYIKHLVDGRPVGEAPQMQIGTLQMTLVMTWAGPLLDLRLLTLQRAAWLEVVYIDTPRRAAPGRSPTRIFACTAAVH